MSVETKQLFVTCLLDANLCISKKDILNVLDCSQFSTQCAMEALTDFKYHKYHLFDALVGENACQLRAAKIVDLAERLTAGLDQEIDAEIENSEKILKQINILKATLEKEKMELPKTKPRLFEYCHVKGIGLKLTSDLTFIVLSHILNKAKRIKGDQAKPYFYRECTDATAMVNLCRTYDIFNTVSTAKDEKKSREPDQIEKKKSNPLQNKLLVMIKNFQFCLSKASVVYLKQQAQLLPISAENRLSIQMIEEPAVYFGHTITPCFYSLGILMKSAAQKNQSALIKVKRFSKDNKAIDEIHILYGTSPNDSTFKMKKCGSSSIPVMVLEGYAVSDDHLSLSAANYIEMFESFGMMEILLANAAQHAQYLGDENNKKIKPDESREQYKVKAEKIGCSQDNPSFFLIDHIYAELYFKRR